jgi:hypothetical protein
MDTNEADLLKEFDEALEVWVDSPEPSMEPTARLYISKAFNAGVEQGKRETAEHIINEIESKKYTLMYWIEQKQKQLREKYL